MIGIIGKKVGMSQFFKEDGVRVPVTILAAGPCPILQVKRPEKDGYAALQLGFGEKRERLLKKPLKGHLKRSGVSSVRVIREMRVETIGEYKEGQLLDVDIFQPGDFVDITGTSIGKGFQGGVKKYGWAGGKASHGSMHHRAPGSIGASSFPSRVVKGHHMPGRLGGVRKTMQNIEVMMVDKEKHLMAVKGSVPGNENSYIMIKESKKMPKVRTKEKPKEAKQEKADEKKKL